MSWNDDHNDDFDDYDFDPSDYEDDDWRDDVDHDDESDEPALIVCNHCGDHIYDDTAFCPSCGAAITVNTSPWSDRPSWWIVLGFLGIVTASLTMVGCWCF
ncbi:MAG: zinc-ribbon domain-containing protein [Planctomycetales bacterium]|nr:zinc-ribbon domain-containing protein [Planctomycetales bacterium]